jgi:GNAT superfamily N-acetyltransferase
MNLRAAREADLPAILGLIAADPISASRPGTQRRVTEQVLAAFHAIDQDPRQTLLVIESAQSEVVGTLQLSLLPGLARDGMWRAIIESVHVRADCRNQGLGAGLVQEAMRLARAAGCGVIQLTSDKRRVNAHRFYERLGFGATHEGMKRSL